MTLHKEGLREAGYDLDELAGEEIYQKVEGDRMIIDLSDVE